MSTDFIMGLFIFFVMYRYGTKLTKVFYSGIQCNSTTLQYLASSGSANVTWKILHHTLLCECYGRTWLGWLFSRCIFPLHPGVETLNLLAVDDHFDVMLITCFLPLNYASRCFLYFSSFISFTKLIIVVVISKV